MSGATEIAIVGILVSGAVGPWLGARFALRLQERKGEQERSASDLADLRALLDEIAVPILVLQTDAPLHFVGKRENGMTIEALTRLDMLNQRLAVRIGDAHPLVLELALAADGIWAGLQNPGNRLVIDQGIETFKTSRTRFLRLANELAGARLIGMARTVHTPMHTSGEENSD